jgi:hypothetical protein
LGFARLKCQLVNGDPTENLDLVADPDTNFKVIMKGGRVYKNSL